MSIGWMADLTGWLDKQSSVLEVGLKILYLCGIDSNLNLKFANQFCGEFDMVFLCLFVIIFPFSYA